MPFYYILKIPIKAILIHALISADNIFLTVSFSSLIGLGKLTWDCFSNIFLTAIIVRVVSITYF